jgi:hypothetical protein
MQKQKTAMQDLFGIIESQIGKNFPQEIKEHFIGREKEQIINAYVECWINDGGNGNHKLKEAENYYKETFEIE